MASVNRSVEDITPPLLIPSLAPSAERLPELPAYMGVPEPVLATNRRPHLANFTVPAVRVVVGSSTVAVYPLHREALGDT